MTTRRGNGVFRRSAHRGVRPTEPLSIRWEFARELTESLDALKQEVARIRWWHALDLGNGIVTPGISDNVATLKKLGLPPRLEGKTVLDIGAWDGYFSFEAERRGALRVLGTDSFDWSGGGVGKQGGGRNRRRGPGLQGRGLQNGATELSA